MVALAGLASPLNSLVKCLAIDSGTPTTIYAGTTGGGVFRSTDGGVTWSAVNTGLSNLDVRALAIDPLTPTTLYAGTSGGGVFKSNDMGGTWKVLNAGLPDLVVNAVAIDPRTRTTVYAGARVGDFILQQTAGAETTNVTFDTTYW